MKRTITTIQGPLALAILSAVLAFGATGAALAFTTAGVPFLVATAATSAMLGVVLHAVLRRQPMPMSTSTSEQHGEAAALVQLEAYRDYTMALRHDIRGVLSPALMMSDRLINHEDKGVQRAGHAVVRSVERVTALLATHKDALALEPEAAPTVPGVPAPPR